MRKDKINVKNPDALRGLLEIALQQFEDKEIQKESNVLQAMVGMQVISTLDSLEAGWRAMAEKIEMAAAEKIKRLSVENQQLKEELELYLNPSKPSDTESKNHAIWVYHDHEIKNNLDKIRMILTSDKFKSTGASAEKAVKKLSDAFSKGINIENEQQKESSDPYVSAFNSIIGALDSGAEEWRKPNQETRASAVEKVREMAALINAFDMGELQESHKHMEAITAKLRNDGFDVKSPEHVNSCVQSLTFENQSIKERAHCFDELQKLLNELNPDSFERECASSLLDDCKHAINDLSEYKIRCHALKVKHQH